MGTKFVIVATARTGSNLVVRSLNNPPKIRCIGEVAKNSFGANSWAFNMLSRVTGYPVDELESLHKRDVMEFVKLLFRSGGDGTIGFKFFYEHSQEAGGRRVWDALRKDHSVSVIHLVRANALATLASLEYARITNKWLNPRVVSNNGCASDYNDLENIELSIESAKKYFDWYYRNIEKARRAFKNHQYLEVKYQDLNDHPEAVIQKIYNFLDVKFNYRYSPPLHKQSSRSLRDKITNFQELEAAFRGSHWERFFHPER